LRAGVVVGTRELPAFLVAFEDCTDKLAAGGDAEALGKCVQEHPGSAWPGPASSVRLQSK
jgi:hypothetical protein